MSRKETPPHKTFKVVTAEGLLWKFARFTYLHLQVLGVKVMLSVNFGEKFVPVKVVVASMIKLRQELQD